MATNTLQTRLALKYDSYSNWTNTDTEGVGGNLVLLPGEIGICAIENKSQGAETAPTVLFKVGDGTSPFRLLKWASALAADVYDWAKAKDIVLTETAVEGSTVKAKTLEFRGATGNVISTVSLNFITEAEVKTITDSIAAELAAVTDRVEETEGNITNITKTGGIIDTRIATATDAINDKLGTIPEDKTLIDLIDSAIGAVTDNIETNAANIASLTTTVANLETKDTAIESRLDKVEAFFGTASDREDGGYEHLSKALDTLVEIQSYLDGDGSSASSLISRVAQNEKDIAAIETNIDTIEAAIAAQAGDILSLQQLTASTGAIYNAIGEATTLASTANTAAATADGKAVAAQNAADAITAYIGTAESGLVKDIKDSVETTATEVAAIKANYLKADDAYIFNCGSSTTAIHVQTAG